MSYSNIILLLCVARLLVVGVASPGVAPLLKLNDGTEIPAIALGTWLGKNAQGDIKPQDDDVQKSVEWAIDAGYRHIDTAERYGVEGQVGSGVANKIADGTVTRQEMYVTSKLWNDKHAKELVVPALKETLSNLKMDYVDLYLIHWPSGQFANGSYDPTDYVETWQGMVEAKKLGLAKSIGLSNFNQQQINRILESSDEKPAVLQVEINLNLQQPSLLAYCRERGILVTGYTPFGSLFPSKARPDAPPPRLHDQALRDLARAHHKTETQLVLRYLTGLGVVPLPKSLTKSRIEENIDIYDFELAAEEKAALRAYDVNYRTLPQLKWRDSPYYPFEKDIKTE